MGVISYQFRRCWVHVDDDAKLVTHVWDNGMTLAATPNPDDEGSIRRAYDCGYLGSPERATWLMTRDHELSHHWLMDSIIGFSPTIWYASIKATGGHPTRPVIVDVEERLVMEWQTYLNKTLEVGEALSVVCQLHGIDLESSRTHYINTCRSWQQPKVDARIGPLLLEEALNRRATVG
jgi:hypothetical protein